MTRINLVPPEELMDQHLFAEFREIKMVPKSLARSLKAGRDRYVRLYGYNGEPKNADNYARTHVQQRIPKAYTLNTGHVSFFYDKGEYLRRRYAVLRAELERRGINFNRDSLLDPDGVFDALDHNFNNDYDPTPEALVIIRTRIAEKIALKPHWYRYEGKPIK